MKWLRPRLRAEAPVLFPTCVVEHVRPEIATAALTAVRRSAPDACLTEGVTCCGQPAWNGGLEQAARRVARRTLRALRRTRGPIVVPAGSCATMMSHHWPRLFAGTRQAAHAADVASRVVEWSAFVARTVDAGAQTVGDRVVAYHDSCHMLRELGIADEPRAVLRAVGVDVHELPSGTRCCGFGGTFAVKMPGISVAMADEKLDEVVSSGCDTLVTCDLSCLLHLEGRAQRRNLPVRVVHLAELIERQGT